MHGQPDVVVLAGGAASRLAGVDKVALPLAGRSALARLLDSLEPAGRVVVVGPPRAVDREVTWCREEPPGGGPLAGVAAALPYLTADLVVVLAGDMPLAGPGVSRLTAALRADPAAEVAALEDDRGLQPLASAFRREALVRRLEQIGDPRNRPARLLLAEVTVVAVPGHELTHDLDTWDDVHRLEGELGVAPSPGWADGDSGA